MARQTSTKSYNGKSTKGINLNLLLALFLLAIVAIGVTVSALSRKTAVTQQPSQAAPYPQCVLSVAIKTPTPTPTPPGPTKPPTSICKVTFRTQDTPVCWWDARNVAINVYLEELPPGGPYFLRLTWRDVLPNPGTDQETVIQNVTAPGTYVLNAKWPGVGSFPPYTSTVETHMRVSVYNSSGQMLQGCTDGFDYYWTPYLQCPVPPFPTPLP